MNPFWCGYLAGIISVFLPSLLILVVIMHRAPDMTDAIQSLEG